MDSDTIILPAEKGNATVLLDKEEYDRKVRELLDDTSYQPIKKNPTLKIPCSSCPAVYTGETGRTLKVRMAEHKRAVRMGDVNNGLAVHSLKTGHPIEWRQARVVEREENWYRRRRPTPVT